MGKLEQVEKQHGGEVDGEAAGGDGGGGGGTAGEGGGAAGEE